MTERVETSLRWVGDWPWWAGVSAALVLGLIAWLLYRRDVATMPWWLRIGLPALRAAAVVMIVVMLSGPVLHHRKTIGELARLWVLVDGSASMGLADASLYLGWTGFIVQQLGLLSPAAVPLGQPCVVGALPNALASTHGMLAITMVDRATWNDAMDQIH